MVRDEPVRTEIRLGASHDKLRAWGRLFQDRWRGSRLGNQRGSCFPYLLVTWKAEGSSESTTAIQSEQDKGLFHSITRAVDSSLPCRLCESVTRSFHCRDAPQFIPVEGLPDYVQFGVMMNTVGIDIWGKICFQYTWTNT